MMNATISEDEKRQIKQYLLGQLGEADEELVELRLMSDPGFSEEFDIVVDEIATGYVSGQFEGDEKTQVEQYFLRSPHRRDKVQFICELLRQVGEDERVNPPAPSLWTRVSSFWVGQPSAFRPAIALATVLIVAGLSFWVISLNSKPNIVSYELALTNADRNAGTQVEKINLPPGTDQLRLKLKLPSPTAPQYRASLRGERISLPQLEIESQDAESITVMIPADQITRGTYAIELTEINNGTERPLRGAYEFVVN